MTMLIPGQLIPIERFDMHRHDELMRLNLEKMHKEQNRLIAIDWYVTGNEHRPSKLEPNKLLLLLEN